MQLPNVWLPPLPNVCDWHKLLVFSNLLIIDSSGSVDGCNPSFLISLCKNNEFLPSVTLDSDMVFLIQSTRFFIYIYKIPLKSALK